MRPRTRRFHWTGWAARAPLLALALCTVGTGGVTLASETGDVPLPEPGVEGEVPLERLLALRRSVREFAPEPGSSQAWPIALAVLALLRRGGASRCRRMTETAFPLVGTSFPLRDG